MAGEMPVVTCQRDAYNAAHSATAASATPCSAVQQPHVVLAEPHATHAHTGATHSHAVVDLPTPPMPRTQHTLGPSVSSSWMRATLSVVPMMCAGLSATTSRGLYPRPGGGGWTPRINVSHHTRPCTVLRDEQCERVYGWGGGGVVVRTCAKELGFASKPAAPSTGTMLTLPWVAARHGHNARTLAARRSVATRTARRRLGLQTACSVALVNHRSMSSRQATGVP